MQIIIGTGHIITIMPLVSVIKNVSIVEKVCQFTFIPAVCVSVLIFIMREEDKQRINESDKIFKTH